MKKLLAVVVLTVASTSAFAGIELKYKGDYVNTPDYDSRVAATKATSRSEFLPNYFRLNANGKVGDAEAKMSLDFTGTDYNTPNSGSNTGNLNADGFVKYVYISKPLADGLTVHFGKLETFFGGIEAAQDELGNGYLTSLANGGNAENYLGRATVGMLTSTAPTGAIGMGTLAPSHTGRGIGLTYNYGMGQVDAVVTNDDNNGGATTQTGNSQKKHDMGLQWSGSFMDGALKPAIGYSVGYADTGTAGNPNSVTQNLVFNRLNVGFDYMWNDLGLTLEWLSNTGKNEAATTEQDSVQSIYLAAAYKLDAWKPFLKYENSQYRDQNAAGTSVDASSFDRNAFTVGVEWMPKAGDALSYHLVYLNSSDKYKATTGTDKDTVSWSQYVAGMRYTADFLK